MSRQVLACAPVTLPAELAEAARKAGLKPYPNTHFPQQPCEGCQAAIYVGPMISAMKERRPEWPLLCMPCAIAATSDA